MLFSRGRVWTADPLQPLAEAVLVERGNFAWVGTTTDAPAHDRVVDLGGRWVVPTAVDPHAHVLGPPCEFANDASFAPGPGPSGAEALALLAAQAGKSPAGRPICVVVGGAFFAGGTARADLDDRLGRRPAIAVGWTGHGLVASSAALALAGVSADPVGEYQEIAFWRALSPAAPDFVLAGFYEAFGDAAAKLGYGAVVDLPFAVPLERAAKLARDAKLPVELAQACLPVPPGAEACAPSQRAGLKLFLDGTVDNPDLAALGPGRAWPGGGGSSTIFTTEELFEIAASADQRLILHAVGDAAVEQALSLAEAGSDVRIEHGDLITPEQAARAARAGVWLVQNPTHLGIPQLRDLGGPAAQDLGALRDAGVQIALGSDAFQVPFDPWLGAALASTWTLRLSREEALLATTRWAAEAAGLDGLGTISVGAHASFAVLRFDPLAASAQEISEASAAGTALTVVDGRVAWVSDVQVAR